MSLFYVTDTFNNNANVIYIRESLSDLFFKDGNIKVVADKTRVGLLLNVDDEYERIARDELFDKISDVIAVGYKYNFFRQTISLEKMQQEQQELLLSSIISADLEDDKRYIKNKLYNLNNECAIDGLYNFRLKRLVSKWREISEYIPNYFTEKELKDFIIYLIGEKRGKKVFVDGDCVYDRRYNRLKKVNLLPEGNLKVIKEILISGASEIELKGILPKVDELYLKEYFGDKIHF